MITVAFLPVAIALLASLTVVVADLLSPVSGRRAAARGKELRQNA